MITKMFDGIKERVRKAGNALKDFWLNRAEPWLRALTVKKVIVIFFLGGTAGILFIALLFFVLAFTADKAFKLDLACDSGGQPKTMTPRAFLPEAKSAKACGASSMV